MTGDPIELSIAEQPQEGGEARLSAYERLIGDAMTGDAMLFARQDGVEAAWAIVEPLLQESIEPSFYPQRSWGPAEAEILVSTVGGWLKTGTAP
jgi:glucose-6-phosphate 1-dehydrogenase